MVMRHERMTATGAHTRVIWFACCPFSVPKLQQSLTYVNLIRLNGARIEPLVWCIPSLFIVAGMIPGLLVNNLMGP